jgi:putative heme-binding domain-containing protein
MEAVQAMPRFVRDNARSSFKTGLLSGCFLNGSRLESIGGDHQWWKQQSQQAEVILMSTSASSEDLTAALHLLWFADYEQAAGLLPALLTPPTPITLQLEVLTGLNSLKDCSVAEVVLKAWRGLTPAVREKAVTVLLARTDRISRLLDAVEQGRVQPAQLSAATKASLARQTRPDLAARIARLFGRSSGGNRQQIVEKYLREMPESADVLNGAKIYQTTCMVCHKHGVQGNSIGPHLGTIHGWTPEQILVNILDPNREVSPNFSLYVIETQAGRTLTGLIAEESASSLTLRQADGSSEFISRSEIKALSTLGISLMPEGLESVITPQAMADLIHFLTAP